MIKRMLALILGLCLITCMFSGIGTVNAEANNVKYSALELIQNRKIRMHTIIF